MTIQGLAELIAKSKGIEDSLYIEVIRQTVLKYRQLLIAQYFERNRSFRQQHIITIENLYLEEVKEPIADTLYYVSTPLPKSLLVTRREPFVSVFNTMTLNRIEYGYVAPEDLEGLPYRKFTSKSAFYTLENDRIKIINGSRYISIRDVWEDPFAVIQYTKQENCKLSASCFEGDDLVIEETMAAKILTMFSNESKTARTREEQE